MCAYTRAREDNYRSFHNSRSSVLFSTFLSLSQKQPVTFHKTTRHFSQNNPSLFTKQPVTFIKRHFIAMKTRVNSSVHQPRSVPNRPTFFHKKRREKSQFEGIDSFFVLIFIIFIGEYKRKCYIAPINKQSLPKRLCFSSKCSTNTREKMRIFFLSRTRWVGGVSYFLPSQKLSTRAGFYLRSQPANVLQNPKDLHLSTSRLILCT